MRLGLRSKPRTLGQRAQTAVRDLREGAGELTDTAGDAAREVGKRSTELVRSVPERLDSSRKRALTAAGAAAGMAAGFAFWRSKKEDRPSVHADPAQPATPVKVTPPPPPGNAAPEARDTKKRATEKPATPATGTTRAKAKAKATSGDGTGTT